MGLHPALRHVVDILARAFPDGVGESQYRPLLAVLREGLSEENLGIVVAEFSGVDPHIAVHDAVAVTTGEKPSERDVRQVRELLLRNGWSDD